MPALELVNKPMNQHITDFYDGNSVFVPNKFMVGFYGQYINETMSVLYNESKKNAWGSSFKENFDLFKARHFMDRDKVLELKWLCSSITLPTPKPVIESSFNIDTIKGIHYPLIKGYGSGPSEIQLTITENRQLHAFQFFNTLMNRFFNPQLFRAKSSFQKLAMYVAVINGDYTNAGSGRDLSRYGYSTDSRSHTAIDDIPLQVFEFNSAVLTGIGSVTLENASKPNVLTYTITLSIPDPFQGAYNTTFKGLRDNTSGRVTSDGIVGDGNGLMTVNINIDGVDTPITTFNPRLFEEGNFTPYKAFIPYADEQALDTSMSYGGSVRDRLDEPVDASTKLMQRLTSEKTGKFVGPTIKNSGDMPPRIGSGASTALPVGKRLASNHNNDVLDKKMGELPIR